MFVDVSKAASDADCDSAVRVNGTTDRDRIDELQHFFHSDRRYAFKLTLSQRHFFRNFWRYFRGVSVRLLLGL